MWNVDKFDLRVSIDVDVDADVDILVSLVKGRREAEVESPALRKARLRMDGIMGWIMMNYFLFLFSLVIYIGGYDYIGTNKGL